MTRKVTQRENERETGFPSHDSTGDGISFGKRSYGEWKREVLEFPEGECNIVLSLQRDEKRESVTDYSSFPWPEERPTGNELLSFFLSIVCPHRVSRHRSWIPSSSPAGNPVISLFFLGKCLKVNTHTNNARYERMRRNGHLRRNGHPEKEIETKVLFQGILSSNPKYPNQLSSILLWRETGENLSATCQSGGKKGEISSFSWPWKVSVFFVAFARRNIDANLLFLRSVWHQWSEERTWLIEDKVHEVFSLLIYDVRVLVLSLRVSTRISYSICLY